VSFCTLGRDYVLLLLHPSLQCHLLLQKLLYLLGHSLQLRILVNTFVAASCLACHNLALLKEKLEVICRSKNVFTFGLMEGGTMSGVS